MKDLDLSSAGPYPLYSWELFFHVPISIAVRLSHNQRFEEAQRWFHYVFDPTTNSADAAADRSWQVRPLHRGEARLIDEKLTNLSSAVDRDLIEEAVGSIGAWKDDPFAPHLTAGHRRIAYMVKVITAYVDNLIAWGDALFRQETGESVDEAAQLYGLAAEILGPRPQQARGREWRAHTDVTPRSQLDAMTSALAETELDIPFDALPDPSDAVDEVPLENLRTLGEMLDFWAPGNDTLLGYWDTVADRLFKARNSRNI